MLSEWARVMWCNYYYVKNRWKTNPSCHNFGVQVQPSKQIQALCQHEEH